MTILTRYLITKNCFLLGITLCLGLMIYTLSDFLQRIGALINAHVGSGAILLFFATNMPFIIAQILPAAFLVSMVVQLSLMDRNRETIALQAGGISTVSMAGFILIYGLVWSCLQFGLTQFLGVAGDRESSRIWLAEVRGKNLDELEVKNLWFNTGKYVVHMDSVLPSLDTGTGITIYELSPDGAEMQRRIYAEKASTGENGWDLTNIEIITPGLFRVEQHGNMQVPIKQALSKFNIFKHQYMLVKMDILELYQYIKLMKASGSNMARVYTNFYHRFAQAFSLLVMGLIALVVSSSTSNIYFSVILSLVITFIYISSSSLFVTMGETEALHPFLAAWMPNILFCAIFGSILVAKSATHCKIFKKLSG